MSQNSLSKEKLTIKAWISLGVLIVMFSGLFGSKDNFLRAFDLISLTGNFGKIYEGLTFQGAGGTGASAGFLFALGLIPSVSLAMGFLAVVEELGAMDAARVLFTPILKPALGLPGSAGIAFISSLNSSDVTAVITKKLYEDGEITDDQRTVFISYQYASSAVIGNVISTQAALLPIVVLPMGAIILILLVFKIMGANLIRFLIYSKAKKAGGI